MKRSLIFSISFLFILSITILSCQKDAITPDNKSGLTVNSDNDNQGLFRSEVEYADIFIPDDLLGNEDLPTITIEEDASVYNEETGETLTGTIKVSFEEEAEEPLFTQFQVSGGLISMLDGQNQDTFRKWWDEFRACAEADDCASYADPNLQALCYFGCAYTSLISCWNDPDCGLI